MKVKTITPEQKARFQEWREKWIRIGLSTEPVDFEKAEKAALRAYTLCKLERPKVILRMGSPYGAIMGGTLAWLTLRGMLPGVDHKVSQQVGNQVLRPIWRQVEQVREQVWQQVCQQVDQQVRQQVLQQVEQQVRQRVWHQVWHQVREQVKWQIWQQIEQQVWERVCEQVGRQDWHVGLRAELQTWEQRDVFIAAKKEFSNSYDELLVGWCAYITFLRDVLGWKDPVLARFSIDEDLVTSCNWVWWNNDILAISDRPSEIHLDTQGRLHNEQGPSIAYRDGWKLYYVRGVAVPDFVIERPETITVKHIEKEMNAEVRRVMVSRMGLERFIRESGLKPIHSDDFGTLYRKEMSDDEPLVVVKVVNSTPEPDGSRKEYFLRVPPTMRRAREAVAWTFGMTEREYLPATET